MQVGGVEFKVTLDWSEFNRDIRNVQNQFKKSGEQVDCIPAKLCTDQLEKQLQQLYKRKFEPVEIPITADTSNFTKQVAKVKSSVPVGRQGKTSWTATASQISKTRSTSQNKNSFDVATTQLIDIKNSTQKSNDLLGSINASLTTVKSAVSVTKKATSVSKDITSIFRYRNVGGFSKNSDKAKPVAENKSLLKSADIANELLARIARNTSGGGLLGNLFGTIFSSTITGVVTGIVAVASAKRTIQNSTAYKTVVLLSKIAAAVGSIYVGIKAFQAISSSSNIHIQALSNILKNQEASISEKLSSISAYIRRVGVGQIVKSYSKAAPISTQQIEQRATEILNRSIQNQASIQQDLSSLTKATEELKKSAVDSATVVNENTQKLIIAVRGYNQDPKERISALAKEGFAGYVSKDAARNPNTAVITLQVASDIAASLGIETLEGWLPGKIAKPLGKAVAAATGLPISELTDELKMSNEIMEIAAQAIAAIRLNPDIKIELVGESFGGYLVELVNEALIKAGYGENIAVKTFGTQPLEPPRQNVSHFIAQNDLVREGEFVGGSIEAFGKNPLETEWESLILNPLKSLKRHSIEDYGAESPSNIAAALPGDEMQLLQNALNLQIKPGNTQDAIQQLVDIHNALVMMKNQKKISPENFKKATQSLSGAIDSLLQVAPGMVKSVQLERISRIKERPARVAIKYLERKRDAAAKAGETEVAEFFQKHIDTMEKQISKYTEAMKPLSVMQTGIKTTSDELLAAATTTADDIEKWLTGIVTSAQGFESPELESAFQSIESLFTALKSGSGTISEADIQKAFEPIKAIDKKVLSPAIKKIIPALGTLTSAELTKLLTALQNRSLIDTSKVDPLSSGGRLWAQSRGDKTITNPNDYVIKLINSILKKNSSAPPQKSSTSTVTGAPKSGVRNEFSNQLNNIAAILQTHTGLLQSYSSVFSSLANETKAVNHAVANTTDAIINFTGLMQNNIAGVAIIIEKSGQKMIDAIVTAASDVGTLIMEFAPDTSLILQGLEQILVSVLSNQISVNSPELIAEINRVVKTTSKKYAESQKQTATKIQDVFANLQAALVSSIQEIKDGITQLADAGIAASENTISNLTQQITTELQSNATTIANGISSASQENTARLKEIHQTIQNFPPDSFDGVGVPVSPNPPSSPPQLKTPNGEQLRNSALEAWKKIRAAIPSKGMYSTAIEQNTPTILENVPPEQKTFLEKALIYLKRISDSYSNRTEYQKQFNLPSLSQVSAKELKKMSLPDIQKAVEEMQSLYRAALSAQQELKEMKISLPEGADVGAVQAVYAEISRAVSRIEAKIKTSLSPEILAGLGYQTAEELINGIKKGLEQNANIANNATADLAEGMTEEMKNELDIQSPSGVFEDIGENVVKGLHKGVASGQSWLQKIIGFFRPIWEKIKKFWAESIVAPAQKQVAPVKGFFANAMDKAAPIAGAAMAAGGAGMAAVSHLADKGIDVKSVIGKATGVALPWIKKASVSEKMLRDLAAKAGKAAAIPNLKNMASKISSDPIQAATDAVESASNVAANALDSLTGSLGKLADQANSVFAEKTGVNISDFGKQAAGKAVETINNQVSNVTGKDLNEIAVGGINLGTDFVQQIESQFHDAIKDIPIADILQKAMDVGGDFGDIAQSVIDGFVDPFKTRMAEVAAMGAKMSDVITKSTKEGLQTKSPSRVFMSIGRNVIGGLLRGIGGLMRLVANAGMSIAQSLVTAFQMTYPGLMLNVPVGGTILDAFFAALPQIAQGFPQFMTNFVDTVFAKIPLFNLPKRDLFKSFKQGIRDTYKEALEPIDEAMIAAGKVPKELAELLAENAEAQLDAKFDPYKKAVDKIAKRVKPLMSIITGEVIKGANFEGKGNEVGGALKALIQGVGARFGVKPKGKKEKTIGEKLYEGAAEAQQVPIKALMGNLVKALTPVVERRIKGLPEFVKETLSQAKQESEANAKSQTKKTFENISNFFQKKADSLFANPIKELNKSIPKALTTGVDRGQRFFNSLIDYIKETRVQKSRRIVIPLGIGLSRNLNQILSKIPRWAPVAGILMNGVGADMMGGLFKGITANSSKVFSGMTKNMLDLVGFARRAVKSNSPSLVFKAIGNDIMDGLQGGISEKTKNATSAIATVAKTLIPAFKRPLKISSPSLIFEALGGDIIGGLLEGIFGGSGLAVNAITQVAGMMADSGDAFGMIRAEGLQDLGFSLLETATNTDRWRRAMVSLRKDWEIISESLIIPFATKVESFFEGYDTFGPIANKVGRTLFRGVLDVIDVWIAAKVLPDTIAGIWNIAEEAIAATAEIRASLGTVSFISGSKAGGKKTEEWIKGVAGNSGASLKSLAAGYAQLSASVAGTDMSGNDVQNLVGSMGQAALTYGMNEESLGGAMTALSQIAGKGVVSMEELRQQLAERMPGAFGIASRAMGLTQAEMVQLVSSGQLLSSEFLPKFAGQLKKEMSAMDGIADPLIKAEAKLNAKTQILQKNIADAAILPKLLIINFKEMAFSMLANLPVSAQFSSAIVVLMSSIRVALKYFPAFGNALKTIVMGFFSKTTLSIVNVIKNAFIQQAQALLLIAAGMSALEIASKSIIGLGQAIASTFGMAVLDTEKWAASTQRSVEKVNAAFKKLDIQKKAKNLEPLTLKEQAANAGTGLGETLATGLGLGSVASALMMGGGIVAGKTGMWKVPTPAPIVPPVAAPVMPPMPVPPSAAWLKYAWAYTPGANPFEVLGRNTQQAPPPSVPKTPQVIPPWAYNPNVNPFQQAPIQAPPPAPIPPVTAELSKGLSKQTKQTIAAQVVAQYAAVPPAPKPIDPALAKGLTNVATLQKAQVFSSQTIAAQMAAQAATIQKAQLAGAAMQSVSIKAIVGSLVPYLVPLLVLGVIAAGIAKMVQYFAKERAYELQKRKGNDVLESILFFSDKTSKREGIGRQALKTGVSGVGVGATLIAIVAGIQALAWKAGMLPAVISGSLATALAPLVPLLLPLLGFGILMVALNKIVNWLRTGNSNIVTIRDYLEERRIFGTEKMAAAAGQLSDRTLTVVQDYKLGKGAMKEVEAIDQKLATLSQQRMTATMEGNQQAVGEIDRSVQKLQAERQEIGAGVFALQDTIAAEIEKYRRNIESESNDAVRENLQIILADLERSNKLLTKYQYESGAIDAVKKFALAVRMLQANLEAAAQASQRLLATGGTKIATVQEQEFSTNRFAASDAQLKTQQLQLDAVQKEAAVRAQLLTQHQQTVSLLPEYGAAMAYAQKHAEGLGRELETADFKYLAEQAKNLGQLGFERVFNEVANTREEIQKTAEMEKQVAEQTTQMLYAQQQAQLEQFQEFIADKQAVLQQGEIKSIMAIKKGQLDRKLSESQAAIKTAEVQEKTAKQNLDLTREQKRTIEQMHRDGVISAEEFTKRMRDLKTEELRGEQSLVEQKLALRQAVNAKILEDNDRAIANRQAAVQQDESKQLTKLKIAQADMAVSESQTNLISAEIQQRTAEKNLAETRKQIASIQQMYQKGVFTNAEYANKMRDLRTEELRGEQSLAEQKLALRQAVNAKITEDNDRAIANRQAAVQQDEAKQLTKLKISQGNMIISDSQANIASAEIQQGTAEKNLAETRQQIAAIQQMYRKGVFNAIEYANRMRDLRTEELRGEQSLAEQKLALRQAVNAKILEDNDRAIANRQAAVQQNEVKQLAKLKISQVDMTISDSQANIASAEIQQGTAEKNLAETRKQIASIQQMYQKGVFTNAEYANKIRDLRTEELRGEQSLAEQKLALRQAVNAKILEDNDRAIANRQAAVQQNEVKQLAKLKIAQADMAVGESQANIISAEIQQGTAEKNLAETRKQITAIQQMYQKGVFTNTEYANRMRDLRTEELRGEQSLAEQKLALRQAVNAKILEDSDRARQKAQAVLELEVSQLQSQQIQNQISLAGQIGGEGSDKVAAFQNNLLQSAQATKQLGLYQQQYQENVELANKKVISQRELETRQMELQKQMAASHQELLKQELELKKQILTKTETENRLNDSRRNTMQSQLQTMQSQNQLSQSQLSNQSSLASEIGSAAGLQDNAAFIQMKADREQAMAAAKIQAARQEFEVQLKILELERQKEESVARQAVMVAQKVLSEAKASGNESAIKVAEQQLTIAEAEMKAAKQVTEEQKKSLSLQLRNSISTAQNEMALARIRATMEKIQAEGNRKLKQLENEKSLLDTQVKLIQAQSRLTQEQTQSRLKLSQLMAGDNKTAANTAIIAGFENQAAQQKINSAKAEHQANLANLKIEQQREIINTNIAIAKARAAFQTAQETGDRQLIQAAAEGLMLEQRQLMLIEKRHKLQLAATQVEGAASIMQAEQEAILTRIQKKLEIIKAAGEERIKGLEREKSLLDAQLRVVQSQSQLGQFGTQSLLDVAGGFNFEDSLQGVKARGMIEQTLSAQKLADMTKEQEMARRGLEIDLAREETRARTNVLVAREALLQAQMLGDQSAIKIAHEQLDISNRELSHQMEIAGLQREGLANEQKLAVLQIQKEQSAARYKQVLDEVKVIAKGLETSLSNQQRSLSSMKELASAKGELSSAISAGEIAQIDRAIELRRRLKDEGLSRGEKAAYQNQLAQTGYMQSEISLLQQKFNLEQQAAQEKWKQLQAEQAIERQLLIIDQQRNMIASKQALAEARIAAIKAQQEQAAARASGDTGRMQLADELVAATQAQIGLLSQNAGLTTFLDQQALQALDYRQRAADVGFRNEQDAARNRFADEMIAAQKGITPKQRWTDGASRWNGAGNRWTESASMGIPAVPTANWSEKNFQDGAIAPEVDKIVSSVSAFDASINRLILAFEEKEKQINRPNDYIAQSMSEQPKKSSSQSTFVAPNQITINVSEATNSPHETGTQVRSEVLKALDDVFTKLKTQQRQP